MSSLFRRLFKPDDPDPIVEFAVVGAIAAGHHRASEIAHALRRDELTVYLALSRLAARGRIIGTPTESHNPDRAGQWQRWTLKETSS